MKVDVDYCADFWGVHSWNKQWGKHNRKLETIVRASTHIADWSHEINRNLWRTQLTLIVDHCFALVPTNSFVQIRIQSKQWVIVMVRLAIVTSSSPEFSFYILVSLNQPSTGIAQRCAAMIAVVWILPSCFIMNTTYYYSGPIFVACWLSSCV